MAGTGRHRRYQPSRINRASLTVTAGGAGMALPLIGAGSAHAASVDIREKAAACESTSNWQINTGNGHDGGLRFTQATWEAYGGTRYAARADLATEGQQIAIAEKVLQGQGERARPTCSERARLTRGGDAPAIAPAAHAEPKRALTSERAASPTTVPTQREGYTVARGDSLSGIAEKERVRGGWQRLYADNRAVVGDDPDLIFPGQRLVLRATAAAPASPPKERTAPAAEPPAPRQQAPKPQAEPRQQTKPQQQKPQQQATPRPEQQKTKPKPQPDRQANDQSLPERHAGLSAPVTAGPSTAYRKAGSSWSSGYHTGVDFPVPTGTSVKAVAAGTVVSAGWGGAYGYEIVIRHRDGRYSQYAHLSALTVRTGQQVTPGQRIARSGSTGNSTGPHLHFEIRTGPGYGSDIDPLAYLRAGGVSI
ncbi:peptidoglycan DD-metalloendopeptidase family protein [Streptomyces sp. NPDC018833]|uniref:peptidoglycan DD-metalloendopeptidase family protein n=1 Tax=Streptomyces sp. NPDC018833 TaxID=3365053 RepID=UPI003789F8F3